MRSAVTTIPLALALAAMGCTEGRTLRGPDGGVRCVCGSRECGDDGCGNSCGTCAGDLSCSPAGQCTNECFPDCTGVECGPDPICGTDCGLNACDDDNECTDDFCEAGRCAHTDPVEPFCGSELLLTTCTGALLNCGDAAFEEGVNGTRGCRDGQCSSLNYPSIPTCTLGQTTCTRVGSQDLIGQCLQSAGGRAYWYFVPCTEICAPPDWSSYSGRCDENMERREVCFCNP